MTLLGFALAGAIAVCLFLLLLAILRAFVRVCPPNHVMVIQGARTVTEGKTYGFKVILGGRAIVIPFLHRAELLDLSVLPINVRVEGVNSANGITVGADATACVCVDVDDRALLFTAVERMLGKSRTEIQDQIQQTMVGNFRGAMNRTTPLEAMGMVESVEMVNAGELPEEEAQLKAGDGERAHFRQEMLEDANEDLSSFGMKVVSVAFQRIWDSSDYISNLATKSVAHKRQEVEVQEARLAAVADSAESDSDRRQTIARSQADEAITEAQQKLGVAEQECHARVEQAKQEADAGISRAQNEAQAKVETARSELQEYKNTSDVTLKAEKEKDAAEIIAQGDNDAVNITRGVRNELLARKAKLLASVGDKGRVPLFVQQQLGTLFSAYADNARNLRLDNLTFMGDGEDDGVNAAVNRGPSGLVDFLRQFEKAFGISVKKLMIGDPDKGSPSKNDGELYIGLLNRTQSASAKSQARVSQAEAHATSREQSEARRGEVECRKRDNQRESLEIRTSADVANEHQRGVVGMERSLRDGAASEAGVRAQIEAEKQRIEYLTAQYQAEIVTPAHGQSTRRRLDAEQDAFQIRGVAEAELEQLEKTIAILNEGGAAALEAYLIDNFESFIRPFADTLNLFPASRVSVITGAGGEHAPISAVDPHPVEVQKAHFIRGAFGDTAAAAADYRTQHHGNGSDDIA